MNNQKFKLWVCDFDGTLVGSTLNPSTIVKKAIKRLFENGYLFTIATGRPHQGIVKKVYQDLNISSPIIVRGGSEIIDLTNKKILWQKLINSKTAKKLINSLKTQNFKYSAESSDFVYNKNGAIDPKYGPGIKFKNIDEITFSKVAKIVINITGFKNQDQFENNLKENYPDLNIVKSGSENIQVLDITSKKATKHLALLELSKILNIKPKNMVGIGDGYNDYALLTACGFKIAMENAPNQLKEIADLIVPTVQNDGVAFAINKLIAYTNT